MTTIQTKDEYGFSLTTALPDAAGLRKLYSIGCAHMLGSGKPVVWGFWVVAAMMGCKLALFAWSMP